MKSEKREVHFSGMPKELLCAVHSNTMRGNVEVLFYYTDSNDPDIWYCALPTKFDFVKVMPDENVGSPTFDMGRNAFVKFVESLNNTATNHNLKLKEELLVQGKVKVLESELDTISELNEHTQEVLLARIEFLEKELQNQKDYTIKLLSKK